jgi:hypothetical protein
MIAGQKIALGRIHSRPIGTVHVAAETITIDLGENTRTVRRDDHPAGPQHQSPAAPQGCPVKDQVEPGIVRLSSLSTQTRSQGRSRFDALAFWP